MQFLPISEEQYEAAMQASVTIGQYCDLVQHEANLSDVELTEENHQFFVANILSAFALYGAHNINLLELVLVGLTRSLLEMPEINPPETEDTQT